MQIYVVCKGTYYDHDMDDVSVFRNRDKALTYAKSLFDRTVDVDTDGTTIRLHSNSGLFVSIHAAKL